MTAFGGTWNRFWFTPADALPCAVLRIVVGLLAIAHFLTLGIDLERWYGHEGLLPPETVAGPGRSPPGQRRSRAQLPLDLSQVLRHTGTIVVRARGGHRRCRGIRRRGADPRQRRPDLYRDAGLCPPRPMIAGHLEPVLGFLLLYLCIGPAGRYLSVDRWLAQRRDANDPVGDEPSLWANLSIRLIQVHGAMFFLMMGLTKLNGEGWWDGVAIWSLLAQTQSRPLDLTFFQRSGQIGEFFVNFWTHAVVYYELAFPILVWNRRARPLVLGVGVVIWFSLVLASGLLLFGLTMLAATAAFIPAETYRALVTRPATNGLAKPAKPALI